MSNLLLAWLNRADEAVLTAGSQADTLPVQNLQSPHLSTRWRSDGVTTTYIDADFGASVAIGVIALLGTNLTAAATKRIRLSNTAPSTGDLLDTGTVAAGISDLYRNLFHVLAAPVTARYMRLDLDDAAAVDPQTGTGAAGFLEAGRLVAAPAFRPGRNYSYEWGPQWIDPSAKTRSEGGQIFIDRRPRYRALSFALDMLTEAEALGQAFELDRAAGASADVLAIPQPDGSYLSETAVWGPLAQQTPLLNHAHGLWKKNYTVEERL